MISFHKKIPLVQNPGIIIIKIKSFEKKLLLLACHRIRMAISSQKKREQFATCQVAEID